MKWNEVFIYLIIKKVYYKFKFKWNRKVFNYKKHFIVAIFTEIGFPHSYLHFYFVLSQIMNLKIHILYPFSIQLQGSGFAKILFVFYLIDISDILVFNLKVLREFNYLGTPGYYVH